MITPTIITIDSMLQLCVNHTAVMINEAIEFVYYMFSHDNNCRLHIILLCINIIICIIVMVEIFTSL